MAVMFPVALIRGPSGWEWKPTHIMQPDYPNSVTSPNPGGAGEDWGWMISGRRISAAKGSGIDIEACCDSGLNKKEA